MRGRKKPPAENDSAPRKLREALFFVLWDLFLDRRVFRRRVLRGHRRRTHRAETAAQLDLLPLFAGDEELPRLGALKGAYDPLLLHLIHQPYGDVYGSWRAMEELYREGRIRAIGVSNFYPDRLQDLILHNEVAPAVNQVETHPFHQQTAAAEFMRTKGVQIESWAPFAEGKNGLFSDEVLLAVAARYKKTVAQVVLRWHTQEGRIIIPKSKHVERMRVNLASSDFDLTSAELAAIDALDDPHDNVSADPAIFMHSQSWADQHVRGNI